jgi:LytS/YehU family sensor histidine kinase
VLLKSRLLAFTAAISAVTVAFSALTVPFLFGTGIHFFQAGIMLAGVVGGPLSGLITGMIGGVYVAVIRSDPTIVIGNALLGLCTGVFSRRLRPFLAGLAAWFLIQAPWIYLTGTFVFHVPAVAMQLILTLLTVENLICASVVDVLTKHFHLGEFLLGRAGMR